MNKGTLYCNFRFVFVEEPEGYSVDAVKKIAEKTEGDPAERQQKPDVIPENIIMTMRNPFRALGVSSGNIAMHIEKM